MDDALYVLRQDTKRKKETARSARKKVRHTGCKLPSDFMSEKEKRSMNGKESSMNLYKPMTYKFFKTLSKEMQEEYILFLKKTFGAGRADIVRMLGVSANAFSTYIRDAHGTGLNITFSKGKSRLRKQEWEVFLSGKWGANAEEKSETPCETVSEPEEEIAVREETAEAAIEEAVDFPTVVPARNERYELIQRWLGVIQGLSYAAPDNLRDHLIDALVHLDELLSAGEGNGQ